MTDSPPRMPTRRSMTAGAIALMTTTGAKAAALHREPLVYIGTQANTAGQGIVAARLDQTTGNLTSIGVVAELTRPTWLIAHPGQPALYAVSETDVGGKVHAWSADLKTGALKSMSTVDSGGNGPAHLALDRDAKGLLVAHYGSGHVAALTVRTDGDLTAPASTQTNTGSGPSPRQTSPHAHGVAVDPSGRFALVADLGADRVFIHPYDAATRQLGSALHSSAIVAPGTGPRHLAFHPNGRFVFLISELIPEVSTFEWNASKAQLALTSKVRAGGEPPINGAEIAVSRDGRFVYASIRVEHVIVVYSVDQESGVLTQIQRIASGGKTPWSFGIDPSQHWLLAANQGSGTVNVFARDTATGRLRLTDHSIPVARPTSIAFLTDH